LYVVLAVCVSQSLQSRVLPAQEVDAIMQKITEPFLSSKTNADRFFSNTTDIMLRQLAAIPSYIKQSHTDLNQALKCAMTHSKKAMTHIMSIFGNVKGIGSKLQEIKDLCPENNFYVDVSELPNEQEEATEEAKEQPSVSSGYQPQIPDLSVLTDMDLETPVNSLTAVFEKLQQEIERSTSGVDTLTAALMADKAWDAHVRVADLLNSFIKIAKNVEAKRIENMKTRLNTAKIAAQHVTTAYAKASYLKSVTSGLSGMMEGIDYSSGPLQHLNKFAVNLLRSLNSVKCAQ